ncbi:hypothetical protein SAMN05421810_10180 [Amycolatopsis arida]|uniref:Head-to-tail stopper n=1 Tax=Amycolatopsis arida TaxID=587909 RepID=A0A1I5KBL9_9PSEU|nr:hypothetical protein [Amycolatopsis arida]TDX96976.1 hypothetical protein CLV69_10278 [Amycolatopsis arida]SFO82472.1 hypothetical protein SAMN05421810_10180 [Amycolatopsis arida]
MTPEGLIGHTVRVSRPAGTNRYGDPLPPTEHDIPGCVLAPAGSTEQTDRADQVTTRMTVYAGLDADVLATDRVVLPDGTRWAVIGEPQRYRSPFTPGASGVCVINLERVTG